MDATIDLEHYPQSDCPTEGAVHSLSRKKNTVQNGEPPPYSNGVEPSRTHNCAPTLLPPAERLPGVKDPFLLVVQVTWLYLIILPSIMFSLFRKIFPPAGKSLRDKVVLVTGAGRGLGRGLALGFAKEGAKVAVIDIFSTPALETAKEITERGGIAKAYTTNVAKIEEIRDLQSRVTEDFGPVDVVVNNAGLMYVNTVEDMSESDLRAVIEVNLLSHFWMVKEFLPTMKQRNSGHIVAISSVAAFMGFGKGTAYSCSKAGIMGFMDSLREELNANPENKVKTTTVYPYFINTSATYMDHLDFRMAPVSIEAAVKATVTGVRRDLVTVTVPSNQYFGVNFVKLLPQNVIDKFRQIFYSRVTVPTEETNRTLPTSHIIDEMTKN